MTLFFPFNEETEESNDFLAVDLRLVAPSFAAAAAAAAASDRRLAAGGESPPVEKTAEANWTSSRTKLTATRFFFRGNTTAHESGRGDFRSRFSGTDPLPTLSMSRPIFVIAEAERMPPPPTTMMKKKTQRRSDRRIGRGDDSYLRNFPSHVFYGKDDLARTREKHKCQMRPKMTTLLGSQIINDLLFVNNDRHFNTLTRWLKIKKLKKCVD